MTTRRGTRIGQRLIAVLLGLTLVLTLLPRPVSAEEAPRFSLTQPQDAKVKEAMNAAHDWAKTGLADQPPAHRDAFADVARDTIRTLIITKYAMSTLDEIVDDTMDHILGVYSASRGSIATAVTPEQEKLVDKVLEEQRQALKTKLRHDDMSAVSITTGRHLNQLATLDQAQATDFGSEKKTLDVYRGRAKMIDEAFHDLPHKQDPSSPFYDDELPKVTSVVANQPEKPQPKASAAPQPVASASAAPPPPSFENPDPDGITVETDDGRTVVRRQNEDGAWVDEVVKKPEDNQAQTGST